MTSGSASRSAAPDPEVAAPGGASGLRLRLVHAPQGNLFMREIFEQIAFEARTAGVDADVVDGDFPPCDDAVYVVIPHEYFVLRPRPAWPTAEMLSRTIALTVEHPGTPWFETSAEQARRCAMIMDINEDSVAELRRRGLTAVHFQPGYSRYVDRWQGIEQPRPTDLVYMGSDDGKRDAVLASCTSWWLRRNVRLLIPSQLPRTRRSGAFLVGEEKFQLLAQSSILVNLHRGASRALEWVRVIEAMSNGAVVVSEHSVDSSPLVAGRHFVSVSPESLGLVTATLLDDPERLAQIRAEGYDFVRERLPLARSVERLLEAAAELLRRPVPPALDVELPPLHTAPPLPWQIHDRGTVPQIGAEVARLRHRVRELELAAAKASGTAGHRGDAVYPHLSTPAFAGAAPAISVVIPVYNKEPFVVAALDSVVASGRADVEILLLDDCSSDRSRERVQQWIRLHPWVPATLLVSRFNGGVARARNALLARARAGLIFTLDADNGIYPTALDAYSAALRDDPAAAYAYAPIEVRTGDEHTGLLSPRPLDPVELRWGNYVDSMAMFRTDVLRAVGGWDEALHTWEDFDLWLRLLEAGHTGVFLPQVHAWYGMHEGTLRTAAGLEMTELWDRLRVRAPTILGDVGTALRPS